MAEMFTMLPPLQAPDIVSNTFRFLIGLLHLIFQLILWPLYLGRLLIGCTVYISGRLCACFSSRAKVHVVFSGPTKNSHQKFMRQLDMSLEECRLEDCSMILVFCPIVTRMGTDMEAALKNIPDDKSAILVLMHHSYNPDHIDDIPIAPIKNNIVKVVQCVFHELLDSGELLDCELNHRAVREVTSVLNLYKQNRGCDCSDWC